MNCHFLLQGIFPTQGLNLGLLHCRRILYQLRHQRNPSYSFITSIQTFDTQCLLTGIWMKDSHRGELPLGHPRHHPRAAANWLNPPRVTVWAPALQVRKRVTGAPHLGGGVIRCADRTTAESGSRHVFCYPVLYPFLRLLQVCTFPCSHSKPASCRAQHLSFVTHTHLYFWNLTTELGKTPRIPTVSCLERL